MKENSRHKCPGSGCEEMLPFNILMCRAHWRQVPRLLQVRIQEAWHNRAKAPSWQEYLDAREAAVAAVNGSHAKQQSGLSQELMDILADQD